MKARPFLAVLLALGLLVLSLGAAGWWLVWQRSPLGLQHRAPHLPRAARFVPRQAPFSLYLLSDAEEPVAYARAVAPARQRRQAADTVERLRDGAFAAAGLDYRQELAGWLAPDIGLALFEASPAGDPDWLLALPSRDGDGARRFLQRFWQTRSLAGTDLQVSTYRGMGLISGRGALAGHLPVPLATALVDDDLLLIASGRGVLEQALDVSQIDDLNQAADASLGQRLGRLGPAAALLVARPGGPAAGLGLQPGDRLLAALRPDGAALRLEALLTQPPAAPPPVAAASPDDPANSADPALPEAPSSPAVPFPPAADPAQLRALLAAAPAGSDRLALLQNPAALGGDPLLGPLVARAASLLPGAGPLPPLLLAAADGPLLAADTPGGWLMATPLQQPPAAALEAPLAAAGLIPAPLELADGAVTVWTRLEAAGRRGGRPDRGGFDRLQAPLEGWRAERQDLALWGRSLALLEGEGPRGARRRERQLEALDLPDAVLAWALAEAPARSLLQEWRPWRRLSALAGGPLEGPVQGLALAFQGAAPAEGPASGQVQELRLRARLEFPQAG
jgi:hypothetical protein